MLRFFSPNSHFKKSSRQIEIVLSLRKNKIPGDIGRWFAEIAEQKKLRCVYFCASTLSKAMCQDKLKLIDTHGFFMMKSKKRCFTFVGLQLTPCSLADAKTVRCAKEFRISRVRRGKAFFKTPGSGNNISFFISNSFQGPKCFQFLPFRALNVQTMGVLTTYPDGPLKLPIWSEKINLFARCWCLQFKVEGRLVCFCMKCLWNSLNDVKRSFHKLSIIFDDFQWIFTLSVWRNTTYLSWTKIFIFILF